MKAYLIDPKTKSVSEIDIQRGLTGLYEAIGCQYVELVYLGLDEAYVDEEGLLNDSAQEVGMFMLPGMDYPVAGRGVIVAHDDEGNIAPPKRPLSQYRDRVRFNFSFS